MLGLGGIVFSLSSIYKSINDYHVSAKKYKVIQEMYNHPKEDAGQLSSLTTQMTRINQEYVGWIKINGTKIHYPVVKTDNNEFYLTHNFKKERDQAGSIFMDMTNSTDKLDQNIILYGHHLKDGSMFGGLAKLTEQPFFNEHQMIRFDFLDSTYTWEIFSVYKAVHTNWMKTSFTTSDEFERYIKTVKKRSLMETKTEVSAEDTILTLATCTNRDEDERIIVHAKLVKKGKL